MSRRVDPEHDASILPVHRADVTAFVEFRNKWSLFLTETHLNLCEELFRNTIAMNRESYETTASKLCQAVGRSRRHTFLLLQQLEKMGFVVREEVRDGNRLLGVRIQFHSNPLRS